MNSVTLSAHAKLADPDSFFSGCRFSPDSTCLLTSHTGSNSLQLYEPKRSELPLSPVLSSKEASSIYSYDWYPLMDSMQPATCAYLSSCRDSPLHLWDAFTGKLRCSYIAYDQNDDPTAATCCRFDPTGDYIYAGYLNAIRVFRTDLPGRSCDLRQTVSARKRKDGQKGIISALAVNPVHNTYAAGSYSGSIYVYDERSGVLVGEVETSCVLTDGAKVNSAQSRKRKATDDSDEDFMAIAAAAKAQLYAKNSSVGITQLEWSNDGHSLFSSSRHCNGVIKWDMRMPTASPVLSFEREGKTNQTLEFCFDPTERFAFLGSKEAKLTVYDCKTGDVVKTVGEEEGLQDACNGVSVGFSSNGVEGRFAVATGQRHFALGGGGNDSDDDDSDDEDDSDEEDDVGLGGGLFVYDFKY